MTGIFPMMLESTGQGLHGVSLRSTSDIIMHAMLTAGKCLTYCVRSCFVDER